ncbi:MAG TPA: hypothetical protein VKR27_06635 [Acidimicrobiales bacterium]|nr:hypothetical protein [Acidimicrobiales bacterium]
MAKPSDSSVEQALATMVEVADQLPGTYRPEVSLGYFPGVINGKRWAFGIEADIYGNSFMVWGASPEEVIALGVEESWRRVPSGDNADLDITPEWYPRDAWLLAAVFLSGRGGEADLADVLGATRRASTPSVFMDRREFGWAASRLIAAGLVGEMNNLFVPSEVASALWRAATQDSSSLSGVGFTRALLRVMQTSDVPATGDVEAWAISETEYLTALQMHIERILKMPSEP